jgi:feruloyl-CoA synthase
LSYAEVLDRARRIGQSLLDRGLSAERPLLILSGNDLEHFSWRWARCGGIPYAPVSPSYSLVATDYGKLAELVAQLTPGALYASDGAAFSKAITAVLPADAELILAHGDVSRHHATRFSALLDVTPTTVEAAHAK